MAAYAYKAKGYTATALLARAANSYSSSLAARLALLCSAYAYSYCYTGSQYTAPKDKVRSSLMPA
jgi:hypothetical protein